MDIPINLIDKVSNLLNPNLSLINNYDNNIKLKELIDSASDLKKLYEVSMHLEGMPRHTSVHAAGIVISSIELDNILPIYKIDSNIYTTGYSMEYLEDIGLLKMDFLGLRNLTLIDNTCNLINQDKKDSIKFSDIPLEDEKTLKLFYDVNTEGIFQFESTGMKNFLRKLKVSCFEDIVAAIALFRPGPMDNIDSYIRRKENKEKIDYIHPDLIKILKPTYGIIIYQEQIMQIAAVMAGYSLGEADVLRKAMSKKNEQILFKEKERFISGSIIRGYSEIIATQVFNLIFKFANYGFNRAHSVAYSIIGYKMAYLKTHYSKYFIGNLLTSVIGSSIKTKEYITHARRNNITILMPDINLSNMEYKIESLGIRYPLTNISNIGNVVAKEIIGKRKDTEFTDFINFMTRCYSRSVNKKVIASLIDSGCFNSFGLNKHTLHTNIDNVINYLELSKEIDESIIMKPELKIVNEYDKDILIDNELKAIGFYLTMHPISKYKDDKDISIIDLEEYFDKKVTIILYIDYIKEIVTKNNKKMAFINAIDQVSQIDLTLFPDIYENNKDLKKGNIIKVVGTVEKRFDKLQIIASKIDFLG